MADQSSEEEGLKIGSVLPVIIENAIENVITVCLEHGAKLYRGVLMDCSNRNMPYGLSFDRSDLNEYGKAFLKENTTTVEPNGGDTVAKACENSALDGRFTYTLDPKGPAPRLLPYSHATTHVARPLRDKNIRSMRLRPRQILCAKCKQGVHDTVVTGSTTSLSDKDSKESVKDVSQTQSQPSFSEINTRLAAAKRKVLDSSSVSTPKKLRSSLLHQDHKSPLIKISFSNPQGRGTVVEIKRKPQNPNHSENESVSSSVDGRIDHDEYHKWRQVFKKAELKEKQAGSEESGPDNTHKTSHPTRRKKSKRSKRKHKHKHKNISDDDQRLEPSIDLVSSHTFDCDELASSNDTNAPKDLDMEGQLDSKHGYFDNADEPHSDETNGEGEKESGDFGELVIDENARSGDELFACMRSPLSCNNSPSIDTNQRIHLTITKQLTSPRLSCDEDNENISDMNYDTEDQENFEDFPGGDTPPGDSDRVQTSLRDTIPPLMMRIQSRDVNKVMLQDGRSFSTGDVVWGKIHGFPWWPGRIITIAQSLKDNGMIIKQTAHVSWFASSTMSHMDCSDLYPFLEEFKLRYNKKKKGPYKQAIKQATLAAQTTLSAEFKDVDLSTLDDDNT